MVEITFSDTWDTQSESFSGKTLYENHDSKLSQEDMKILTMKILDIPNMRDISSAGIHDEILSGRLTRLSNVLQDKGGTDKIFINKGIHQRDDCPHFTMNVTPIGLGEGHFEIFVRPDRVGKREWHKFHWQPWAISFSNRRIIYHWPTDTDGRRTNVWTGHNRKARRNSIILGNIVAVN
ncbi:hypothetical protein FE249_00685 [Acidiphilium multivorum]|uniref:hypothetical protein n=1 Tax=Acidiphilium multivorum TaxID=62140 RepID=UPI001F4C22DE|nr:hypothetical protein [Acidiphilium multivorum]UNC12846.1 hypothetical protein FE249_00685 [Acidiphilium multivorum]